MDPAISLYLGGKEIYAGTIKKPAVVRLRLACPSCLESVILVYGQKSHYFAHYRRTPFSPECPLRVESGGGYGGIRKKVKVIFVRNVFRGAFRVAFSIAFFPSLVSPYKQAVDKLVKSMQRVWLAEKREINISDLLVPQHHYLRKWTHPGRLVQGYISERAIDFPNLAPLYKSSSPSKAAKEQTASALLLWRQLHLKRYEKDLRFLLLLSYHMCKRDMAHVNRKTRSQASYSMIAGHIMFNALRVLSAVPWAKMPTLVPKATNTKCASCRKDFLQVPEIEVRRCSVCGKPLCICCAEKYRCKKCYSDLCKGCVAKHVCSK